MHAFLTYIFCQSLDRLQHGLSAIAELLVIKDTIYMMISKINNSDLM